MTTPIPEPFILLAVDPALQGVYVWGPPGVERAWPLDFVARWLTGRSAVTVPATIAPEQLASPLDVQSTLAHGRPVHRSGVVERARHGALLIAAAELMAPATAARLVSLIREQPRDERPLLLVQATARPRRDDPIAAHCALWLPATPVANTQTSWTCARSNAAGDERGGPKARDDSSWEQWQHRVAAARARLAHIPLPPRLVEDICRRVDAAGGGDQSLDFFVARTARARAAWHGRKTISPEDVDAALRWIVGPRADEAAGADDGDLGRDTGSPEGGAPLGQNQRPGAAAASPPPLAAPAAAPRTTPPAPALKTQGPSPDGARGPESAEAPAVIVVPPATLTGALSLATRAPVSPRPGLSRRALPGRPMARTSPHRQGSALALFATLLAAMPYQRLRPPCPPLAVRVLPDDLRWRRHRPRPRSLYILAVDGSGSMAQGRMQLAKGAALSVLQGAYRERRYVALLDFRHRGARLLCPPGRSSAVIRRHIGVLPSGGGTPLPAALALALRLVQRWRLRHPDSPCHLILFTDGKANVPLQEGTGPRTTPRAETPPPSNAPATGTVARQQAWADAKRLGALLRAARVACTLIDTSPPGAGEALPELARCLGAGIIRLAHRRR